MNPALIAALNQASWELMNGNPTNVQSAPVAPQPPQISGQYPSTLPGGSSPSRQFGGGYNNAANQFRENWWNNGYSNTRQTNSAYNTKSTSTNSNAYFTRRKNFM